MGEEHLSQPGVVRLPKVLLNQIELVGENGKEGVVFTTGRFLEAG